MKHTERELNKGARSGAIGTGIVLVVVGRLIQGIDADLFLIPLLIGLLIQLGGVALVLTGCYYWTQMKNRHWAFMFWGLLAPVGFLGLCFLRERPPQSVG